MCKNGTGTRSKQLELCTVLYVLQKQGWYVLSWETRGVPVCACTSLALELLIWNTPVAVGQIYNKFFPHVNGTSKELSR